MVKLTDLGFSKDVIVETVISTFDEQGEPNAAPMGVIMKNQHSVLIKVYNSSLTYRSLLSKKSAVVNVTSDVEFFFKSTFKDANPEGRMPRDWFEKAKTIDSPKLSKAEATIEISVEKMTPIDSEKTEAVCNVRLVEAAKILPKAYCRAFSATVEALIHTTRINLFLKGDHKQREEAAKLMQAFASCRDTVGHVAPESRYAEIMAYLGKKVETWRVESESIH
jgi:uncharacterized protein